MMRYDSRHGLSLLELVMVLTLLGILVAVGTARMGPTPVRNFASHGDARRLAFDLLQARRRAIAKGENHYLEFTTSGGQVAGYSIYRRISGGGTEVVDAARTFPNGEIVTSAVSQIEFTFEGAALASGTVTFAGPDRSFTVQVMAATGAVKVTEL